MKLKSTVRLSRHAMVLAACACAALPAFAHAAAVATIDPSFLPNRLGASTAFTLAIRFAGGEEEGVPPPLGKTVVHLPAGLRIDVHRVSTCDKTRVRARGARGCPPDSEIGRGRALLESRPATQTITEEATLTAFRGPDQNGRPAILILSQGYTPLEERTVISGVLGPDAAPYGGELTMSLPAIPTLVGEPGASTASLSLTIGAAGEPRAHAAGPVTVPRRCPVGGFPFAANFTFADGSTAGASAQATCPKR